MRKIIFILMVLGLTFFFTACEKDGSMEKAGEKIDQAVEETKEEVRQAKEKIEGTIKN